MSGRFLGGSTLSGKGPDGWSMGRRVNFWVGDILEAFDNMRGHQGPQSWHHDHSQFSLTVAYLVLRKAHIIIHQHHISYGRIQRAASNLICDQHKVLVVVLREYMKWMDICSIFYIIYIYILHIQYFLSIFPKNEFAQKVEKFRCRRHRYFSLLWLIPWLLRTTGDADSQDPKVLTLKGVWQNALAKCLVMIGWS